MQTCCDPSPLTLRGIFNAGTLGKNQVGQKVAGGFLMAACVCDAVCFVTIHLNVKNVHAETEFFFFGNVCKFIAVPWEIFVFVVFPHSSRWYGYT